MILFDFKRYWNDPGSLFSLSTLQAAGVYQGGFLVAFVTAMLYMRRQNLPVLATCDVFAPGIALGQAIGRLGCFSAGCCWGIETHVPWAVTFRNPQAAELTGVPLGIPLHPDATLRIVRRRADFRVSLFPDLQDHTRPARSLGWYLALYSVARFVDRVFPLSRAGAALRTFLHAVDFARDAYAGGLLC